MDSAQAEFLQTIIDQRNLNLNTWNFFVSIHIAIAGILFIIQRRIFWPEKFVVVLGYSLFMYMNWSAQIANYSIFQQMLDTWSAQPLQADNTIRPEITLEAIDFADPVISISATYGVAWALTVLFISFINRLARRPTVN